MRGGGKGMEEKGGGGKRGGVGGGKGGVCKKDCKDNRLKPLVSGPGLKRQFRKVPPCLLFTIVTINMPVSGSQFPHGIKITVIMP